METEKIIREMENRGYTVTDESGVLMFTGLSSNLDESIAFIKKDLESLGFGGSWGTKGYPKGKAPKTVTAPAQSAPVVGGSKGDSADDSTGDFAGEESSFGEDMADEPAFGGDVADEPDISSSDFTQMTFDFT